MTEVAPGPAPDLSVVIPAFNESVRLPPTVRAVEAYLRASNRRGELIIVDDGSSDGTAEVVDRMIGEGLKLHLLRHDQNRGKGAAVRTGMLAATGGIVLFTDADLSTPIVDVEPLIAALAAGADVAIGSRAMDRSLVEVHQPWIRDRMGRIFNLFVQAILLPGLKDTQCGFKAFRRDAARDLFTATLADGFEFDTEVLYRARRSGLAIREIPVHWRNSPDTRVNALVDSPRMLLALFRIRRIVR
ncbi:MAG TPA: dolichyl-phosphate beta-glucosyltransferase [Candidatus Dormibacteraeota bacterium]